MSNNRSQQINLLKILPQPKRVYISLHNSVWGSIVVSGLVLISAALFLVMNVVMLHQHTSLKKQLQHKESQISAERKKANIAGAAFVTFADLPKLDQDGYSVYLQQLGSFYTKNAWLSRLDFSYGDHIRLLGLAINSSAISNFLHNVKQQPAFKTIDFKRMHVIRLDHVHDVVKSMLPERTQRKARTPASSKKQPELFGKPDKITNLMAAQNIYNHYRADQGLPPLAFTSQKHMDTVLFKEQREREAQKRKREAQQKKKGRSATDELPASQTRLANYMFVLSSKHVSK